MKVIVCLDNSNGLLFNNRRLSKDINIINDILDNYDVVCSNYSSSLFNNSIDVFNDFNDDKYYFIEDIIPDINLIDEVIIYRWNRDYPSDVIFDIDLSKYEMISSCEFTGNSHDVIGKYVYRRVLNEED